MLGSKTTGPVQRPLITGEQSRLQRSAYLAILVIGGSAPSLLSTATNDINIDLLCVEVSNILLSTEP